MTYNEENNQSNENDLIWTFMPELAERDIKQYYSNDLHMFE